MSVYDNGGYLVVDYGEYCPKCKHKELKENEPPCDDCLENGSNFESDIPVHFKVRTSQK